MTRFPHKWRLATGMAIGMAIEWLLNGYWETFLFKQNKYKKHTHTHTPVPLGVRKDGRQDGRRDGRRDG